MATLFSYFTKSPKVGDTPGKKQNNTPKLKSKAPSPLTTNGHSSPTHQCGAIVWSKLEGHPYWPSMVCKHPTTNQHHKSSPLGSSCYHVQFFGQPPSRAWIDKKEIKLLSDHIPSRDGEIQSAFEDATEALTLSPEKRIEKYYACVPSDCEDDEEESDIEEIITPSRPSVNGKRKRLRLKDDTNSEDEEEEEENKKKKIKSTPTQNGKGNGKRKRAVIASDSEDDYKPSASDDNDSDDEADAEIIEEASDEDCEMSEEENTKSSKKVKKSGLNKLKSSPTITKQSPLSGSLTPNNASPLLTERLTNSVNRSKSALARFSSDACSSPVSSGVTETKYTHETLKFLQDGQRRDKNKKLHTDPEYDARTLLIPDSYMRSKEVTPGMRQWWNIKSDNFDSVLFFKVGKFYELYHMDATVAVKELGLIYMRGAFAHAGFPEIAFSRYSESLIQKGYKVGRVEQTETPQMLADRCAKKSVNEKVVRRELCAVISKGTKTYSFLEGDTTETTASFLLSICERTNSVMGSAETNIGICFVDTSIGTFHVGQFRDDRHRSRLRTMISQFPPVQVVYERNGISSVVSQILNRELVSTLKESLAPATEFWNAQKTLKMLTDSSYFKDEKNDGDMEWPSVLQSMMDDPTAVSVQPCENYQLALSALGGCTWYLKKCFIDHELLSMKKFKEYIPVDVKEANHSIKSPQFPQGREHMILDSVTLSNLDITMNSNGGIEGTLLEQLDHCQTPFGKRLFRQWLCSPLCHPSAINDRLDAVEDLMSIPEILSTVKSNMAKLPDLERLLRRIHAIGSLRRSKDHPDSRAIFYNESTYSKRKINDLLSALQGFRQVDKIISSFSENVSDFKSKLLQGALRKSANREEGQPKGRFPELEEVFEFFAHAFDHEKAKKEGLIMPKKGVHEEYDNALSDISSLDRRFQDYLEQQRSRLGCSKMNYWGSGKTRYQLEVPESYLQRKTLNDYHLKSQKKGFRRFWTDTIESLLGELTEAEERRDAALRDTMRKIFSKFDQHHACWETALQCVTVLDCLMSLTKYSSSAEGILCRPEVVMPTDETVPEPFLEMINSRHPCIGSSVSTSDFIPNDIIINKTEDNDESDGYTCVLVTGPNMGGKSTLMRQAGALVIMAQMGCYVPAEKCRFSPVDRVFTRLGAHDRILHGESTFFVELSETSTILQHATRNSLVFLDELGRGTATFDGTAIASSVVHHLAHKTKCRMLFSTHYHSLVDEFADDTNIRLRHMACMVENEDEDGDPTNESITFLYKVADGACPKSYGFNAAKLAGIPIEIIRNAYVKAREFEETTTRSRIFRSIVSGFQSNSLSSTWIENTLRTV